MWEQIEDRARKCAEYMIKTGATVRACASHFGISKSTVHKDVTERLEGIDSALYCAVKKVLEQNLKERHIRGGSATKRRYEEWKKRKGLTVQV